MELINGTLIGLGALRQGEQRAVCAQIDPLTFGPLPASIRPLGNIAIELLVHALGTDYIVTLQRFAIEVQGPCSICGHKLAKQLDLPIEHTVFSMQQASAGHLDLTGYLTDLLMSLVPDSIPCTQKPCEWREDVDRFIEKSAQQKTSKAFHPFRALLTSKKWNPTQE